MILIEPIEQPPEGYGEPRVKGNMVTFAYEFIGSWSYWDAKLPHPVGSKVPVREEWFSSLVDSGENPYKYRDDYKDVPEIYNKDCWQPADTMPDEAVRKWQTVTRVRVCQVRELTASEWKYGSFAKPVAQFDGSDYVAVAELEE